MVTRIEYIESLFRLLVPTPDSVQVTESTPFQMIASAADGEMGMLMGKQGRNCLAVRHLTERKFGERTFIYIRSAPLQTLPHRPPTDPREWSQADQDDLVGRFAECARNVFPAAQWGCALSIGATEFFFTTPLPPDDLAALHILFRAHGNVIGRRINVINGTAK